MFMQSPISPMDSFKNKEVRILLVGEDGVGKTSLIMTLVSEEFPMEVPGKAEEITIPPEVTPEKVPTHIVDFSTQEQDEQELVEEINKASVICAVYAVDDDTSLERIRVFWLPLIRRICGENKKPVVLVGNKSDTLDSVVIDQQHILDIMNDFSEVETCVECSARNLKNISEVFYYAQKAVLHPTQPLYVPEEKDLTAACKGALTRIFKICDQDNDGVLNDVELNFFQQRCFNVPLQSGALEDVKNIIRRNVADGVQHDSMTLAGFLYLHCLFIQKGRHETTWTVLRRFGYDNELKLNRDYLRPKLEVPRGSTVELTHISLDFLTQQFIRFDRDHDMHLLPSELEEFFSACPAMPWNSDVLEAAPTDSRGWYSLQTFLAQWVLFTYMDPFKSLETLAYIGFTYFRDRLADAVTVTRVKSIDLEKRQTLRTVFLAQVYGRKGVGKSAFLQGLINRNLETISPGIHWTISSLTLYGQHKHLILKEMDSFTDQSSQQYPPDAIVLLYDVSDPTSFQEVANFYMNHLKFGQVPCQIVAARCDSKAVTQDFIVNPQQFCRENKLPSIEKFSAKKLSKNIYTKMGILANYPFCDFLSHYPAFRWIENVIWPQSQEVIRYLKGVATNGQSTWMKLAVAVALFGTIGFVVCKKFGGKLPIGAYQPAIQHVPIKPFLGRV